MISQPIIEDPRPWAFTQAALTAGLRAQANDPSLVIADLYEMTIPYRRAAVGRIRGLTAVCESSSGKKFFRLAVKEPHGTTRTGTAGAGLREVLFYKNLANQLPVRVPRLFASHPNGDWLIMELLPLELKPESWSADDYLRAIEQLVAFHDRFWTLGADLSNYLWLARPFGSDFAIYLQAATTGLHKLRENRTSDFLSRHHRFLQTLRRLIENADQIATVLRLVPTTLLHGDYWPGNINISVEGDFIVYDWQQASIGPGISDLFHFIQASQWYFSPLPISPVELTSFYRARISAASHHLWEDSEWDALWDYALLWDFLTNWVDMFVDIPDSLLETQNHQLETLWIEPVRAAIDRRFPGDE